jgi:hypothetical protein
MVDNRGEILSLVNSALVRLGSQTIALASDFGDWAEFQSDKTSDTAATSDLANLCKNVFGYCLKSLIESNNWNGLTKQAALDSDDLTTTPTHTEFRFAYTLPTDFLRLCEPPFVGGSRVSNDSGDWYRIIDGGSGTKVINTDQASLCFYYIGYDPDGSYFFSSLSNLFKDALVSLLEAELAYPITNNATLQQTKYSIYLQKLNVARQADMRENPSPQRSSGTLIYERGKSYA